MKHPRPAILTLTSAASARLRHLHENGRGLLRLSVGTKGCSGHSYEMNWVPEPQPGDEEVHDGDVRVLVDRRALLFLIGSEMDYRTEALSSSFTFTNPNEKGRCGCGESFHV